MVGLEFASRGCSSVTAVEMDHEIVGHPTDVPWAFKFHNYWNNTIKNFDPTPRHPSFSQTLPIIYN